MKQIINRKNPEKFYEDIFGLKTNFNDVVIPAQPTVDGEWRLIFMSHELIYELMDNNLTKILPFEVVSEYHRRHPSQLGAYYDINEHPTEPYALWINDKLSLIPGESAISQIDPLGQKGPTLLEHLVHWMDYYFEYKKYLLESRRASYCTGSRDYNDEVPTTFWIDEERYEKIVFIRSEVVHESVTGSGIFYVVRNYKTD